MASLLLVAASRSASAQTTARVTVDGASIWSAPSVPSIVLATVKAGTQLEVLGQTGSWYRVKLPGDSTRTGYILMRLVDAGAGGVRIPPTSPGTPQARATRRRGPPRRAFLSVSAGYQPAVLKFENKTSFTEFVEQGSRTLTYTTRRNPLLDVGAGVEVRRGLFITGAVSRFSGSSDAAIDEQVPHPLFFGQPRSLKATAADLPREEIAVHIQAAGLMPINQRMHLMIAAGPSLFKLKQTLVTDVKYTQEYPYDTVTFSSAIMAQQQQTGVGINGQADLVVLVSRHVAVDGLLRYSRASLSFSGSDGAKFSVLAGGVHVGVGLRAEF